MTYSSRSSSILTFSMLRRPRSQQRPMKQQQHHHVCVSSLHRLIIVNSNIEGVNNNNFHLNHHYHQQQRNYYNYCHHSNNSHSFYYSTNLQRSTSKINNNNIIIHNDSRNDMICNNNNATYQIPINNNAIIQRRSNVTTKTTIRSYWKRTKRHSNITNNKSNHANIDAATTTTTTTNNNWKPMTIIQRMKFFMNAIQLFYNDYQLYYHIINAGIKTKRNAWNHDHNPSDNNKTDDDSKYSSTTSIVGKITQQPKFIYWNIPRRQRQFLIQYTKEYYQMIPTIFVSLLPIVGYIPIILSVLISKQILTHHFWNTYEKYHHEISLLIFNLYNNNHNNQNSSLSLNYYVQFLQQCIQQCLLSSPSTIHTRNNEKETSESTLLFSSLPLPQQVQALEHVSFELFTSLFKSSSSSQKQMQDAVEDDDSSSSSPLLLLFESILHNHDSLSLSHLQQQQYIKSFVLSIGHIYPTLPNSIRNVMTQYVYPTFLLQQYIKQHSTEIYYDDQSIFLQCNNQMMKIKQQHGSNNNNNHKSNMENDCTDDETISHLSSYQMIHEYCLSLNDLEVLQACVMRGILLPQSYSSAITSFNTTDTINNILHHQKQFNLFIDIMRYELIKYLYINQSILRHYHKYMNTKKKEEQLDKISTRITTTTTTTNRITTTTNRTMKEKESTMTIITPELYGLFSLHISLLLQFIYKI